MKFHRIWAVVMRHLYYFRRNWDRISDSIYWPVMNLLVWGITANWLKNSPQAPSNVLLIMLTGVVFWQIVWRANYEISVNLLEETWTQNMVNMFASPLQPGEWAAGVMLVGVIKVIMSAVFGMAAAWVLYSMNILALGYLLIPFLVSLVLFGWSMGFLASGLVLYFGRRVQTFAWMMGFLFAPLSAVYYPVSALPLWTQKIAYLLPTTYVFEGMREVLSSGKLPAGMLSRSFGLNAICLTLAMTFFAIMFEKRKVEGLQKLE